MGGFVDSHLSDTPTLFHHQFIMLTINPNFLSEYPIWLTQVLGFHRSFLILLSGSTLMYIQCIYIIIVMKNPSIPLIP
jgi:hypothetical protein